MASQAQLANPKLGPEAGFSLLEAIVALAIIGIALVPAMAFFASSSQQMAVAADANQRAMVTKTILAVAESLNPTVTPTGEMQLSGSLAVSWESIPLLPNDSPVALGGRLGGYRLKFYDVAFNVVRDDQDWFQFNIRKIGYQPRAMSITGQDAP